MPWLGHLHHPAGFSQWKLRPGWICAKLSVHQSLQNYCTVFYSLNQVIPKKSRYKMQGPTFCFYSYHLHQSYKAGWQFMKGKKKQPKTVLKKISNTYPKWNYETHDPGFLKTATLQEVVPPSLDSTDSGLWGRREDTGEIGTPDGYMIPSGNIQKLWKNPPFSMDKSTINHHFQ